MAETASVTFDTIRDRLFQLMREQADAGDEAAKRFLETRYAGDGVTITQHTQC